MATLDDILEPLVALELRPRDVCRLRRVCRKLRVELGRPEVWQVMAQKVSLLLSPGLAPLTQFIDQYHHELDECTAYNAELVGAQNTACRLTLKDGERVAAVNMQACFIERPSLRAEYFVDVGQFDDTAGPVLWIGLVVHRNSLAPERERMLDEGTLEETLAPFLRAVDLSGRTAGAFRSRSLMERFLASKWSIIALGSNGYAWGHGVGGKDMGCRFGAGDRVTIGVDGSGKVTARVNGAAPITIVRRFFAPSRGLQRPPARLYPIIHLTDIQRAKPVGGEAEITRVGFGPTAHRA